jgi:hypothetical protein
MAGDLDPRTARTVARSIELVDRSLLEIARLACTIDSTKEMIAGSRERLQESKRAMAEAMRIMW